MHADAAALDELAAYAASQRTTGLLVVQGDRTLLERNFPLPAGSDDFERRYAHGRAPCGALREDVASQQKSLVALLVAVAADRGLLDVEDPVSRHLGPAWSRAGPVHEPAVRIRHLLEMSSGLDDTLAFTHPPDLHHHYNTPAYALLLPLLEAAAGRSLESVTQDWLTGPLGMVDTAWVRRGHELATELGNAMGLVTTPRDLATLGRFVMDGGVGPDGTRLVSAQGLAATLRRSPLHPAYGRLWWLNGGAHWVVPNQGRGTGSVVATAPDDALFALGSENRVLMVVPSQRLLLVRLGRQAPDGDLREQLALRLAAALHPTMTA